GNGNSGSTAEPLRMESDKLWRFQSQTSTGAATGAYRTQSGRNAAAQHQAPASPSAVMSAIVETRMEFIAREPRVVKAGSSLGSVECDNKGEIHEERHEPRTE